MTSQFLKDSIFWIEVEKIHPNPFQPRREFEESKLNDLADSIRMYGVLQPLVVNRKEKMKDDGGLMVEYELISGERRLRASKLAGLEQVPVIVRSSDQSDREKLELAIIENLQREDLNPVERARAFHRLVTEFNFKHGEVASKVGKSRVYVSNTVRILGLPEIMLNALSEGKINEGHTRPLLMLIDRPQEQENLFNKILAKRLNVRDAEQAARRIAVERARKHDSGIDPELAAIEDKLKEFLGTKVRIEKKDGGGKITIEFFSDEDLRAIVDMVDAKSSGMLSVSAGTGGAPIDDRTKEEIIAAENDEDLYSLKNFSI